MAGRVIFDIRKRSANPLRLLWNRLTPTRGMKKVSRWLMTNATEGPLAVTVHQQYLLAKDGIIPGSRRVASSLLNSGITNLEINRASSSRQVRQFLNTLTDRSLKATIGRSSALGFKLEDRQLLRLKFPITWSDLHQDLAQASEFDIQGLGWLKLIGIAGLAVFSHKLASFVQHGKNKYLNTLMIFGGIAGTYLLAASMNFARKPWDYLRILFPSITFRRDYLQLTKLAGGLSEADQSLADDIFHRLHWHNRKKIAGHYAESWDHFTLNWALKKCILESKDITAKPRIKQLLRTAKTTNDPASIKEFARSSLYLVRAAAAKNKHAPLQLLDKLVNHDPERAVRSSVAKNPQIKRMLAAIEQLDNPQELARYANGPFPCVRIAAANNQHMSEITIDKLIEDKIWSVRVAAAQNKKAKWQSVARVISDLREDYSKRSEIRATRAECGAPYEYIHTIITHGYFGANLKMAQKILDAHPQNRAAILGLVENLNKELHKALIS